MKLTPLAGNDDARQRCPCGRELEPEFGFCPCCGRSTDAEVLCQTMRRLAQTTFEELAEGYRLGLAPNEETLTDKHLLELQRRHPGRISVKRFSKAEEAANGADWEWWFHRAGRGFGMRVQAKRQSRQFRYPELGRNAGSSGHLQVDRLIEDAAVSGILPYYALYNHRNFRLPRTMPLDCDHSAADQRHLGCTITSALTVRAALSRGQRHKITFESSEPWHLLFCCASTPKDNLGESLNSVRRLHDDGFYRYNEQFDTVTPERVAAPHPDSRHTADHAGVHAQTPTSGLGASMTPHTIAVTQPQQWAAPLASQVVEQLKEAVENAQELALPDRALQLIRSPDLEVRGPDPRVAGAVLIDFGGEEDH